MRQTVSFLCSFFLLIFPLSVCIFSVWLQWEHLCWRGHLSLNNIFEGVLHRLCAKDNYYLIYTVKEYQIQLHFNTFWYIQIYIIKHNLPNLSRRHAHLTNLMDILQVTCIYRPIQGVSTSVSWTQLCFLTATLGRIKTRMTG